jgi:hypothetical protein
MKLPLSRSEIKMAVVGFILATVGSLAIACASSPGASEALDWAIVVSDGIDIVDQLDGCNMQAAVGDDPIETAIVLLDLLAESEANADIGAVATSAAVVVSAHDDCVRARYAAGEIDDVQQDASIRRSARFLRAIKRLEERYDSTE